MSEQDDTNLYYYTVGAAKVDDAFRSEIAFLYNRETYANYRGRLTHDTFEQALMDGIQTAKLHGATRQNTKVLHPDGGKLVELLDLPSEPTEEV